MNAVWRTTCKDAEREHGHTTHEHESNDSLGDLKHWQRLVAAARKGRPGGQGWEGRERWDGGEGAADCPPLGPDRLEEWGPAQGQQRSADEAENLRINGDGGNGQEVLGPAPGVGRCCK